MALSAPRTVFGIHSFSPYSRSTFQAYGIMHVLGGSTLGLEGELVELKGGSAKYSWAAEDGPIGSELSLKVKEFPDFLFELWLGKAPTAVSADTAGTVSALTNKYGTTVFSATIGIATITVIPTTGAANLKFSKYIVKAVSATTVKIYPLSDVDFARGTDETYDDDTLDATGAITVTSTGGTTDVASLGLRITGGSGTVALVTGDVAFFSVKPPSTKSMSVRIGSTTNTFPEFGALLVAQRRSNNEMCEIELFRVKAVGMPLPFEENKWAEAELKASVLYDSAEDALFELRHISES